jgi:integrase
MALTDTQIKAAQAKDKVYQLSDGDGLSILIKTTGRKLWRFRYTFGGKEAMISLGGYPEVSLAQARERRLEARKLLANGVSPSEHKKAVKRDKVLAAVNNLEAVSRQWHEQWKIGKSERHARIVMTRLETDVFPSLGNRAMADLQALELVQVIKSIAGRGAVDLAKRNLQVLSMICRYAVAHNLAQRNPAADVRPSDILPSVKKQNYARVDIKELPALLRAVEAGRSSPVTRLAVRLLALTFVRTSELINARWEEFDFEEEQWRIPASRMKMKTPHIVPLARQTLEVLELLKQITGDGALLFPSRNDHTQPMSNNTILKCLEIAGYKHRMTGHGFRGIASTALHEQGYNHEHIELQLAHSQRDAVSAAYNHALYLSQRTKMMQDWADYLDSIKIGGNVIGFRAKAGLSP